MQVEAGRPALLRDLRAFSTIGAAFILATQSVTRS